MKYGAAAIYGPVFRGIFIAFVVVSLVVIAGCAEVRVSPSDVILPLDQQVSFAANVDHDLGIISSKSQTITWTAYNLTEHRPARISPQGTFTARLPGVYEITAHSGDDDGHAKVTVPDGVTFNPNEKPSQITPVSSAGDLPSPPALPPPPVNGPGWRDSDFPRAFYFENRLGRDLHRGRIQFASLRTARPAHAGSRSISPGRPFFQNGPGAQTAAGIIRPHMRASSTS